MQLTLRHATNYSYSEPITYAIQTLRLTPQAYEGMAVLKWQIRGAGRRELPSYIDGFGNLVHCHSINRSHDSATITVEGSVETRDTGGRIVGAPEPLPPGFYRRETALTQGDDTMIGRLDLTSGTPGALDWALRLMESVRARVDYQPGTSDSHTTAREALENGVGVCQDHAHVFIAACRCVGVPARYVSGYLYTGASSDLHEASHAWAEAFVTEQGWIGFDPSNRTRPNEAYIRVAVGLDYHSAAPVRGVRRGPAVEKMNVSVRVSASAAEQ